MFPCEMARYIAAFSREARKSGRFCGARANLGPRPPFWPALLGPSVAGRQAARLEFLPVQTVPWTRAYIETGVTSIDDLAQQSHHWPCALRFCTKFPTLRPSPRVANSRNRPVAKGLWGRSLVQAQGDRPCALGGWHGPFG